MEFPGVVKNLEIPQILKNIELPRNIEDAIKGVPNVVSNVVKEVQLPEVVRNIELPDALKGVSNAVKEVQLPNAVRNIELPDTLKDVANSFSHAVKEVQNPNNPTTRRLSLFASSALTSVASLTQMIQQKVEETTKNIQNEHEAFVKQVKGESIEPNSGTEALPPWEGLPNEDELKDQMLALSKDKRNFLINPPENTNFQFDLNIYYQNAIAVLNVDPNLKRMRFELVPSQVQEYIFWRNYFYRISLIKQTALGSIDAMVLENEVYSKNADQAEESTSTTVTGDEEKEVKVAEEAEKEEIKEVLFDVNEASKSSDIWTEDDLVKTAGDGEEEIIENWEEEMRKEISQK